MEASHFEEEEEEEQWWLALEEDKEAEPLLEADRRLTEEGRPLEGVGIQSLEADMTRRLSGSLESQQFNYLTT